MGKYIKFIVMSLISVMLLSACAKSVKTETSEINVDYKEVKTIELYDLDEKKIKEFSKDEYSKIIGYLNSSKISNDSYILMIVGKIMKITFNDSSEIRFSSYGSVTNCVVSGMYKNNNFNYHLISPEIAKILLEK